MKSLDSRLRPRKGTGSGNDRLNWLSFRFVFFPGLDAAEKEDWAKAETHLRRALEIRPACLEAGLALAQAEWNLGQKEEGAARLRKLMEQEPTGGAAHFLLGKFYWEDGNTAEAQGFLEKSVQLDSKNAEGWLLLGKIYLGAQKNSDAMKAFREASFLDPFLVHAALEKLHYTH